MARPIIVLVIVAVICISLPYAQADDCKKAFEQFEEDLKDVAESYGIFKRTTKELIKVAYKCEGIGKAGGNALACLQSQDGSPLATISNAAETLQQNLQAIVNDTTTISAECVVDKDSKSKD